MNTARNWILLTLFTLFSFLAVKWIANYQDKKNTITEPTVDIDVKDIIKRSSVF